MTSTDLITSYSKYFLCVFMLFEEFFFNFIWRAIFYVYQRSYFFISGPKIQLKKIFFAHKILNKIYESFHVFITKSLHILMNEKKTLSFWVQNKFKRFKALITKIVQKWYLILRSFLSKPNLWINF
jgi:hypothetical protein